jgi:circadian clock protein KaiB
LFIAGQTLIGVNAFNNLKIICEEKLNGRYQIEVIDILENPQLASENQILAIPTLEGKLPVPVRKIIGDPSHAESVMIALDLI